MVVDVIIPVSFEIDIADSPVTFIAGTSSEVSVSDSNSDTNSILQVSLSVNDGTLTLSQTNGLNFVQGLDGESEIVIEGSESDINAALDGMVFMPDAGFAGDFELEVSAGFSAGLVAQYTFEGGDATDQSAGTSFDGTFNFGASTTIDPVRGEVLDLEAPNDRVSIPDLFDEPESATLSAWVNLDVLSDRGAEAISLGDNLLLRLDSQLPAESGVSLIYRTNTGEWFALSTDIEVAGTGWRHIAVTFDEDSHTQAVYIDGNLVAESNRTESVSYTHLTLPTNREV